MRRMTLPWVSYASTCRLPPHLGQQKTSTPNVLRTNPAPSSLRAR
ncbi:hypothetical protein KYC5002_20135 [Archangium violaceum]|nr:hypothetical protein KYC5002_20135 [Archangium gephyra]